MNPVKLMTDYALYYETCSWLVFLKYNYTVHVVIMFILTLKHNHISHP